MNYTESETVELKSIYVDDIKKEIVAFANTQGGTIYIGVEDDGTVCGVDQPDRIIQQITNAVRDAIKPDVTMFLHYEIKPAGENKKIVEVRVQCGAHRPYYLAAKGLRPEGVFVRQGTSSVPASDAAIRKIIKETDGDNYEDVRSLEQELTFEVLAAEFAKNKIALGEAQMKTLGLTDTNGLYTNLALLLSDQCPHIIKAATFGGKDQSNFQNRKEFTGSLLKQLEDAYAYLDLQNQTKATFEGLYRIDHRDYPYTAIRESLLNAIVHRDYSVSASTLVSVYTDRIEMISIGGLAGGISYEDMMLGVSYCRNRKLADVFYRLGLIEAYGTGMNKIMSSYENSTAKPDIIVTSGAFKTVLPNCNVTDDPTRKFPESSLSSNELEIKKLFLSHSSLTRAQIEKALGVSTSTACRIIKNMLNKGELTAEKSGKSTEYRQRGK